MQHILSCVQQPWGLIVHLGPEYNISDLIESADLAFESYVEVRIFCLKVVLSQEKNCVLNSLIVKNPLALYVLDKKNWTALSFAVIDLLVHGPNIHLHVSNVRCDLIV